MEEHGLKQQRMVLCGDPIDCDIPSSYCEVMSRSPPACCLDGSDAESTNNGELGGMLCRQQEEQMPFLCAGVACSNADSTTAMVSGRTDVDVVISNLRDHGVSDEALTQHSDDSTFGSDVPYMVASEMVVTTTRISTSSKQRRKPELHLRTCFSAVQPTFDGDLLCCNRAGDDRLMAATSSMFGRHAANTASQEPESAQQRLGELVKSRGRMRLKRSDPAYRELERQRDRERRRCARQSNASQREAERARDKEYRRQKRRSSVPCATVGGSGCAVPSLTAVSSSTCES